MKALVTRIVPFLVVLLVMLVVVACATSPTGRRQLQLVAPAQLDQMGEAAYSQIQTETPVVQDPRVVEYVECVTRALTAALPSEGATDWDVTVFRDDDQVNAFALPGGNIGVYTGLLRVSDNPSQLATVIGHEIAHVEAQHTGARISTEYATQAGLQLAGAFAGDGAATQQVMALLGLGAQVGLILPYSRAQETEADILGLEYMARAGFDPRESVPLWYAMEEAGGGGPPEFLSTHPAGGSRIERLQAHMPQAMALYQEAQRIGYRPGCREPDVRY